MFQRDFSHFRNLLESDFLLALAFDDDGFRLRIGQFRIAGDRLFVDFQVAILPLPRRVVHEGNQMNFAVADMLLDLLDHLDIVDLETGMDAVADHVIVGVGGIDGFDQPVRVLGLADRLHPEILLLVEGKRMKHRRDAVRDQDALAFAQTDVEIHHRGRPRRYDGLDVIGMDIHEARRNQPPSASSTLYSGPYCSTSCFDMIFLMVSPSISNARIFQ